MRISRTHLMSALLVAIVVTPIGCGGGGGGGVESDVPTSATVAFTRPGESLDLANYTLSAKYDLPVGSGVNLLASEASAVTYDKDTNTLFVVGDGGTAVVQVNKTGQLVDSMQLPQDPLGPQGTHFYDTEGITYIGGGTFVFVEERYRQVDRFVYTPATILSAASVSTVKLGTTIGNVGIEGLCFDPFSGGFVFVKEKTPLGVFQSAVDFGAGTATNGSAATVDSTNLFDPALLGVVDLADVCSLSTVLSPLVSDYGHLILLSQESGLVQKVDRTGTVHSSFALDLAAQTEGITMDLNRVIYTVNELGGGASHPQLWVFTPTTTSNDVGVRSRIYVTFDKPVKAGSGLIKLDDGAGDLRNIDPIDATQVTFSGNLVTIDPTADLRPGHTYTLSAAAGVWKTAQNNAVPSLGLLSTGLSFTTAADHITPVLDGTAPLDNASGVAGSHVILTFSEPVMAGSGQIVLHSSALGDTRTIAVTDVTQVTFGGNTVDINPSADLKPGTSYFVTVDATAVTDLSGNAFVGISSATEFNFGTAGSAPQTPLAVGDLLFVEVDGDGTDSLSFILLKAVGAGTQICFTDKDYVIGGAWPINEAGLTWAADRNYPAGTIVTILPNTPAVDKGLISGIGGGISSSAETYYAFVGTITNAATGDITVDHFLAAINSGGLAAGAIPPEVTAGGTHFTSTFDNYRYAGSYDESDLPALSTRIKTPANWVGDNLAAGYPVFTNNSVIQTPLAPNDLLFMGVNGSAPDAIAFVLLKAVTAGTQICFTDKNFNAAGTPFWPTNEAALTWTANVAYAAGTIVTIQTNAPATANKGSVVGTGGGISTTAETYYAFIGTIADADAGDLVADKFLAAINVSGAVAGDIPASLTAAGTYFQLAAPNAKYAGSLATGDVNFPTWVKDTASWATDLVNAFPLVAGGMFP